MTARQKNHCPRCDLRPNFPDGALGQVVARERIGGTCRVCFTCAQGHQWDESYPWGSDDIPPPGSSIEDERGVLNPRPAPEPQRCLYAGCNRQVVLTGGLCVEHATMSPMERLNMGKI